MNSTKDSKEYLRVLDNLATFERADNIKMEAYFRICRSMVSMANDYEKNGLIEKSYVLNKKFAYLFLKYISTRRDYATVSSSTRNAWTSECKHVLEKIEVLQKKLIERFESNARLAEAEAKKRTSLEELEKEKVTIHQKNNATFNSQKNDLIEHSVMDGDEAGFHNNFDSVTPSAPPLLPIFDRSLKPKVSAISNSFGLTTVHLPKLLTEKFFDISAPNSHKNIETCGTLCGKLSGQELVITHLVLLKQVGTCDSCSTQNEEELITFMESRSLTVIGWIHTHPTQSVFMSSIDLHCQLSYQIMMPEAIAIVCSPKHREFGFFSLTPDYGIPFLRNCKQSGFHKHSNTRDLYASCSHVVLDDLSLEVEDLR